MTRYALTERLALADLMEEVGPDAPTLCGTWRTRDLAAHIVLRERRPDAAGGILIKSLADRTERVLRTIAAQPYRQLVAKMRKRPWWAGPIDEQLNLTEMFIHHEDVRRAAPQWTPRDLTDGLQAALWKQVPRWAKRSLRRFKATVVVEAPGFGTVTAGAGGEEIRVKGDPGELLLFLSGRQGYARVSLDGSHPQAERLQKARLGI